MVQCNFCTREKGLIISITHAMGFKAILVEKKHKINCTQTAIWAASWAAILISETSSVVSGVTASCNIKQVSFFFSG